MFGASSLVVDSHSKTTSGVLSVMAVCLWPLPALFMTLPTQVGGARREFNDTCQRAGLCKCRARLPGPLRIWYMQILQLPPRQSGIAQSRESVETALRLSAVVS